MNDRAKPKIHFILPGGGVRGAFQAGFLCRLFEEYSDSFELVKADGTSIGALNAVAICSKQPQVLKEIWYSINGINDIFDNWSKLGRPISYYYGFYKNGLFSNKKVQDLLKHYIEPVWFNMTEDQQKKYSCTVVNVQTAETKYVLGTHPDILKYIAASSSPWIVSNPVEIDGSLYTDGGLLETYPIKNINSLEADMTVILGYDQEHFHFQANDNNNLLEYLANLIDIARFNSVNTELVRSFIKNRKEDVICLSNPMRVTFADFNKETIDEGFRQGEDFADAFYSTYLDKEIKENNE